MSDPWTTAHQLRKQHLMEQQAESIQRLATLAEAQSAESAKGQVRAYRVALASMLVAAGSLAVAVIALFVR